MDPVENGVRHTGDAAHLRNFHRFAARCCAQPVINGCRLDGHGSVACRRPLVQQEQKGKRITAARNCNENAIVGRNRQTVRLKMDVKPKVRGLDGRGWPPPIVSTARVLGPAQQRALWRSASSRSDRRATASGYCFGTSLKVAQATSLWLRPASASPRPNKLSAAVGACGWALWVSR